MTAATRYRAKHPESYGRYSIQRVIAQGGMAAVYAAKDPVLLRPVAVKVLHDKLNASDALVQRFFQEARTVAQLQSPNIVEVFDFGEEDGTQYLVMEFVDGLSLQGVLDSIMPARMDPIVAAALMCQAAEGLLAASRRNVVHRDIKPANLLVSPHGHLKIADFGISHIKDQTQTRTGAIIGTAVYMSPEQAKGEKGVTSQSDMFSLGSVFYKCLSGEDAFLTETPAGTLRQIIEGHPTPLHKILPDLDPELLRLVDMLLQKDPQKRGGGPAWLKTQLREYLLRKQIADPVERIHAYLAELSGRGIQTTGFVSPIQIASAEMTLNEMKARPRGPKPRKDWSLKVFLAAVVLLAAVAAGIWWMAMDTTVPDLPPPTVPQLITPAPQPIVAAEPAPPEPPQVKEPQKVGKARERRHLGLGAGTGLPLRSESRTAATAPGTVYLTLNTAPPFCEVSVDGKPAGTAPLNRLPLTPGAHRFRIEAEQVNAVLDTVLNLTAGSVELKLKVSSPASR